MSWHCSGHLAECFLTDVSPGVRTAFTECRDNDPSRIKSGSDLVRTAKNPDRTAAHPFATAGRGEMRYRTHLEDAIRATTRAGRRAIRLCEREPASALGHDDSPAPERPHPLGDRCRSCRHPCFPWSRPEIDRKGPRMTSRAVPHRPTILDSCGGAFSKRCNRYTPKAGSAPSFFIFRTGRLQSRRRSCS